MLARVRANAEPRHTGGGDCRKTKVEQRHPGERDCRKIKMKQRHPGESRDLLEWKAKNAGEIPAFAGMTGVFALFQTMNQRKSTDSEAVSWFSRHGRDFTTMDTKTTTRASPVTQPRGRLPRMNEMNTDGLPTARRASQAQRACICVHRCSSVARNRTLGSNSPDHRAPRRFRTLVVARPNILLDSFPQVVRKSFDDAGLRRHSFSSTDSADTRSRARTNIALYDTRHSACAVRRRPARRECPRHVNRYPVSMERQ